MTLSDFIPPQHRLRQCSVPDNLATAPAPGWLSSLRSLEYLSKHQWQYSCKYQFTIWQISTNECLLTTFSISNIDEYGKQSLYPESDPDLHQNLITCWLAHFQSFLKISCLIDWVKVLRPTTHKIGHFGDVLQTNLLTWYRKTKPNTTKAHIHQSKEMYYNTKYTQLKYSGLPYYIGRP